MFGTCQPVCRSFTNKVSTILTDLYCGLLLFLFSGKNFLLICVLSCLSFIFVYHYFVLTHTIKCILPPVTKSRQRTTAGKYNVTLDDKSSHTAKCHKVAANPLKRASVAMANVIAAERRSTGLPVTVQS